MLGGGNQNQLSSKSDKENLDQTTSSQVNELDDDIPF